LEFLLALQFLTRIPVVARGNVDETRVARSMAYFPLVGLLLGLAAAALEYVLSLWLKPPVCDLTAIVFLILITGNLHGDALMDSADGIFSGRPRERMLEIMRDSRVGSHGMIAGVLLVVSKLVLLGQLPFVLKLPALILMPALGRWDQVFCAAVYSYARSGSGTGSFTDRVDCREIAWASLTVLGALGVLVYLGLTERVDNLPGVGQLLLLTAVILVWTVAISRYMARKIGGMTGDTLGATSELVEIATLFVFQFF